MEDAHGDSSGDRGPSISNKRIEGINSEPVISIFYKTTHNSPLQMLERAFSKDAATVFCERIRHDLQDSNAKAFTITGGDLQGYKDIFDWIKQSVTEGKPVFFQTLDETIPGVFMRYAHAIEAADYLGIPARSFSEGLTTRLTKKTARDVQMTWDEVEYFYNKHSENGLRDVAAASIFYAWWKGKLNEDDTPEDMMFLDVLREDIPNLDEDLHKWCEKNEATIRAKWAEKDREKEARAQGNANGDFAGAENVTTAIQGDWNDNTFDATGNGSSWDTPGSAGNGGPDWLSQDIARTDAEKVDWYDETAVKARDEWGVDSGSRKSADEGYESQNW